MLMLSIEVLTSIQKQTGWQQIYFIYYCPWWMNMSSLGTQGYSYQFSIDISQIVRRLSSLATAITDSSLGWNFIDVIGQECQLKHSSSSSEPSLSILKSQTLTLQSSEPVTIRWLAFLFQSQTFTSFSWARIFIDALLQLFTRMSTI